MAVTLKTSQTESKSEQPMLWASALSNEDHGLSAASTCCREIKASLHGETPDVLFVFIHASYGPNFEGILEVITQTLKPVHLLGGSAGGVIGAGREVEDGPAISMVAGRLPRVQITPFYVDSQGLPGPDEGPKAWEKTLGVTASRKPHFVLVSSPGMRDIEALLQGLDYAYPGSKKVGGLASGMATNGEPCVFFGTQVKARGAAGLAFSGDIKLDTLVAQGCRPIGQPMAVTGCERNLLTEMDGKHPVEVLAELFEEATAEERSLMNRALFLGVAMDPFKEGPPKPGEFLIRTVLGIDPQSKAVAVGALLRTGQTVQFHVRDAGTADEDLRVMFERYERDPNRSSPLGALLFSCLGRGEHMYGEPDHDSRVFQHSLGKIPLGGFFCNGEIGPVQGNTFVHGFTSSFGLFSKATEDR